MYYKHGVFTFLTGNYQNTNLAKVLRQKYKSEEAICINRKD